MDKGDASRRIAEVRRFLVADRRTIDKQRELIARLEHMGIDIAKQRTLLSRLLEDQAQHEKRLAELQEGLGPSQDEKLSGQGAKN